MTRGNRIASWIVRTERLAEFRAGVMGHSTDGRIAAQVLSARQGYASQRESAIHLRIDLKDVVDELVTADLDQALVWLEARHAHLLDGGWREVALRGEPG